MVITGFEVLTSVEGVGSSMGLMRTSTIENASVMVGEGLGLRYIQYYLTDSRLFMGRMAISDDGALAVAEYEGDRFRESQYDTLPRAAKLMKGIVRFPDSVFIRPIHEMDWDEKIIAFPSLDAARNKLTRKMLRGDSMMLPYKAACTFINMLAEQQGVGVKI